MKRNRSSDIQRNLYKLRLSTKCQNKYSAMPMYHIYIIDKIAVHTRFDKLVHLLYINLLLACSGNHRCKSAEVVYSPKENVLENGRCKSSFRTPQPFLSLACCWLIPISVSCGMGQARISSYLNYCLFRFYFTQNIFSLNVRDPTVCIT